MISLHQTSDVRVVVDPSVISLCRCPYYKHRKGCPNWGKKEGCPPGTGLFTKEFEPVVSIVIARLDFKTYLDNKRLIRPDWTERALRNPRHWQGRLRAQLKTYAKTVIKPGQVLVTNPEALGVNVFETCENAGFPLERYPQNFVCQVAFLATLNPG